MAGLNKSALDRAGTALLHAAKLQAQLEKKPGQAQLNDAGYRALLTEARKSLAQANPIEGPHKFLATKTALETLEAVERGDEPLGGVEIFRSLVESVHGGERDMDFGGRRRQGPKVSVNQAFLRAAAVALWERFPEKRDQLLSHARTLIGVGTKVKARKLVENHNNRHDVNITKSGSALSIHMPLIRDLIEHHGYRTLKDFA